MSGVLIGGESAHAACTPPLQFGAAWVYCRECYYEGDTAIVLVRTSGSVGLCPSCGTVSRRVHSRYRRRVTDLPLSGRIVELLVIAPRFRCDAILCRRQIFTERFAEGAQKANADFHAEIQVVCRKVRARRATGAMKDAGCR